MYGLDRATKAAPRRAAPKMTAAMIAQANRQREEKEAKARAKKAAAASKVVGEAEYAAMAERQNSNREIAPDGAGDGTIDGGLAALGGDAARIQAMAAAGGGGLRGQNQAAKGKMTYKVFESTRLPELKAEKPGLQGSQYRDSETATLSRFVALSVSLTQPLLQCARRSGSAPQ